MTWGTPTHRWPIRSVEGQTLYWAYGEISSVQTRAVPHELSMLVRYFKYPNGQIRAAHGVTPVREDRLERLPATPDASVQGPALE